MSNGRFGHLWFASIAIIVGGGGLLEHGSKFSLLSAVLGTGFGIWLQWAVELVERSRKRRAEKQA
jgi:uncharacterized membrane protein (UPF0136 family)